MFSYIILAGNSLRHTEYVTRLRIELPNTTKHSKEATFVSAFVLK